MDVPDNYDIWEEHDRALEQKLNYLPVCTCCGNPISDYYIWAIGDELLCDGCAKNKYRRYVESFMRGD